MGSNQIDNYLASDEELLLSFVAEKVTRGTDDDGADLQQPNQQSSQYQFGATDRRIVYLSESGAFKDIDYQHISSIESDVEVEEEIDGGTIKSLLGCCGGTLLLGGIVGIADSPGFGFILLLIGIGLIAATTQVSVDSERTEKQKMKFVTGDEADQRLEVTLTEDADTTVGAELSGILREQR